MSMPDKWEYPWYAAWDLAFHCVALAHVDPAFARYQLILLCREWFQHPNGALPAYEWDFSDVNPPVQAWAALEVFAIFTDDPDGRRPCFGGTELMQRDPAWHDNLIFSEYFHGDNGAAIGAFHQTGWTGVIADLIRRRHGEVDSIGDVVRRLDAANREPREP